MCNWQLSQIQPHLFLHNLQKPHVDTMLDSCGDDV